MHLRSTAVKNYNQLFVLKNSQCKDDIYFLFFILPLGGVGGRRRRRRQRLRLLHIAGQGAAPRFR